MLLKETILKNAIDVVATGGLSGQYNEIKAVVDIAKATKPEITTVVGGGIITADPEASMKALENVDYGVSSEGEIAINALAYALETRGEGSMVSGVIMKNGKLVPPLSEISNLDCLPFPDYDGLELGELLQKKSSFMRLDTCSAVVAISRSCPWNCTFCFHPSGTKYRRRSLNNIFEEIDWLIAQYKVKSFIFCDELFVDKSNFIYKFCERIKPYNIIYWAQTRVDMINKEIAQNMKDSGCSILSLGAESADDSILRSMRKFTTVVQIELAFDAAISAGIMPIGNIILGDLEETPQTIHNSLAWLKRHQEYPIEVFWILTFPGSYLYKIACERGIIKDRIVYLKKQQFQLNVSKMTDDLYTEMVSEVDLFNLMRRNKEVFLPEKFKTRLEAVIEEHIAAVWPATTSNVGILFKYAPNVLEHKNLRLINSNPSHTGIILANVDKYTDKKVYLPDIIVQENIETIIFIFRDDVFETIVDSIKKSYPSVKRIIHIRDLLE